MRVLDIAIKDLTQIFRDWKSLLFLILMPLLFTFFFGSVFGGQASDKAPADTRIPVGVIVAVDDAEVTDALLTLIDQSAAIRPVLLQADSITDAQEIVSEGDLAAVYYIPENFLADFPAEGSSAATLIADRSQASFITIEHAFNLVQNRINLSRSVAGFSVNAVGQQAPYTSSEARLTAYTRAFIRALEGWQEPAVTLESIPAGAVTSDLEAGSYNAFTQSSPGMIVQFAVFGLMNSAMILVLEKKNRALHRMLVAPLSAAQVILGHVLGMFVLTFMQEMILVLTGQFLFQVNYFQAPLATLIMMIVVALWSASLGLLIGVVARKDEQVTMYSLIAMFVLSILGGAWFPLDMTGETFSTIGHLLPSAWVMDGFQNIIIRGMGLPGVLLPAAIVLAYGAGFFVLAIARFRKSIAL